MVAKKVKKVRNVGIIVVRGRERKLYEGSKGGIFYRSKGSKVYVDKKVLGQSLHKKKRVVAKKKNKFGTLQRTNTALRNIAKSRAKAAYNKAMHKAAIAHKRNLTQKASKNPLSSIANVFRRTPK